jgi:tRNA nucleotidyltransferase (CCA-adding enzyme)
MMTLENDVLRLVKPTPAQDRKVMAVVEELSKKVLIEARKLDAHIETMLVGSVAKGTHLKDPDVDLFMLFQSSTPLEDLKRLGLEIGRRVVDGKEYWAQHPYVRGMYGGFQIDLVPCFKIRDTRSKLSAVDRTPFHTEFVKKNLKKGMADQVRLLKRFMKGVESYGAEAKVQGFSGYLCELLIIRFGSFRKVLEVASGWKVGEHIDIPGFEEYGGKFDDPLTFIDPVDTTRNVASAVSHETLLRLIMASRGYLAKPDIRFFFPSERKVWTPGKVKEVAGKRIRNLISVTFPKLGLIDDVVYPQLRKSLTAMTALLERADFEVEKTSILVDDRTHLLVELTAMELPKERKHRGPPVKSENVSEFLAKWDHSGISAPYVEDSRWWVMTRREWTRGHELLKAKLKEIPLGKDVKKLNDLEVESDDRLLVKEHLGALTNHFDDRMPWQR